MQEENNYLIKNADAEISKISEFIDQHTMKQKQKMHDMRDDYERKLSLQRKENFRLSDRVKQLEKYTEGGGPLPPYESE